MAASLSPSSKLWRQFVGTQRLLGSAANCRNIHNTQQRGDEVEVERASGSRVKIKREAEFEDEAEERDLGVPSAGPATVADVLEAVADNIPNKTIEQSDVSAAQSAETAAFGQQLAGGPVSAMQSAFDSARDRGIDPPTVSEVLSRAGKKMVVDTVVSEEDAERAEAAEARNDRQGRIQEGGVADTMRDAADVNRASGFTR